MSRFPNRKHPRPQKQKFPCEGLSALSQDRAKGLRGWLSRKELKYAMTAATAAGLTIAKWFTDAYSLDRNVGTFGNAIYWNSYESSFTPWPHLGKDLSIPCIPRPPRYLECQPRGVPDLNSTDRMIHGFLHLSIPFANIPLALLIGVGIVFGIAYVVYKLLHWERRSPLDPELAKSEGFRTEKWTRFNCIIDSQKRSSSWC